jgi:hypothetical protein
MTTTAPQTAAANAVPSVAPNVYHLHGGGIHITYYPSGSGPLTKDGPVKLVYEDTHVTKTFRADEVTVTEDADLGTLVSVVLRLTVDVGSTTATLLIPPVVLGEARSVPIHTLLIRTVHSMTLTGLGQPQRAHYTTTHLEGSASVVIIPL